MVNNIYTILFVSNIPKLLPCRGPQRVQLGRGTQLTKPSTQVWIAPNQEPTLELYSRAAPSVVAYHRVNGPDTGRKSGGRQIIKRCVQEGLNRYSGYDLASEHQTHMCRILVIWITDTKRPAIYRNLVFKYLVFKSLYYCLYYYQKFCQKCKAFSTFMASVKAFSNKTKSVCLAKFFRGCLVPNLCD